mgnify:CR=1 FL=1
MNSDNYKIIEPKNLKIEKDLFEYKKQCYIFKDLKKEIQIIKEKLEKINSGKKLLKKEIKPLLNI